MTTAGPVCIVIQGFGKKIDLPTGRELDLDKSYQTIVKPAIEEAGYSCVRLDEISHGAVIDKPHYEMLLQAELAIADLSTGNLNAMFDLGLRYALRPRTTIVIAEREFKVPLNLTTTRVHFYEHHGEDVSDREATRMRKELARLAGSLKDSASADSPVYVALPDLRPPVQQDIRKSDPWLELAPRPPPLAPGKSWHIFIS